jgi:hypothetical protein
MSVGWGPGVRQDEEMRQVRCWPIVTQEDVTPKHILDRNHPHSSSPPNLSILTADTMPANPSMVKGRRWDEGEERIEPCLK